MIQRNRLVRPAPPPIPLREKLGICQWFHYEDYREVHRAIAFMHELGIRHLRTGVSWADFHRDGGAEWYDWQMKQLEQADIEVLLSVWHTPPSIAEGGRCAGPPRHLPDYARFIEQLIDRWGNCFSALELWNEPNNLYKWNFRQFDPQWEKFGRMIALAGQVARRHQMPAVLGGMIPVDHEWLQLMDKYETLDAVDVVAIHGFPEMWWDDAPCWESKDCWHGWGQKVRYAAAHAQGRPIWITETGVATCDLKTRLPDRHMLQIAKLSQAALAPAPRVYWYSLIDLAPYREAIEGFHVDENEYHMGLVAHDGTRKPAFYHMQDLLSDADRPVVKTGEDVSLSEV